MNAVAIDDIILAYRNHGSVWKAGKALGISGQSVHERLRAIGHKLNAQKWTVEEVAELHSLAASCTIGEAARRLGRTYNGVACKMSELELPATRARGPKIPRGAGFDKSSIAKHVKALERYPHGIARYCRSQSIGIDVLVAAIQRDNALWWESYSATHTNIPQRECGYCHRTFFPQNARQEACTRKCQGMRRVDRDYFGGNRRNTIGLAEGVCQLCERKDPPGLSSHHMIGKENDPENLLLIALCPGCHQMVGQLAGRTLADTAEGWENLINLVLLRRSKGQTPGFYTTVEIEPLTEADLEDEAVA